MEADEGLQETSSVADADCDDAENGGDEGGAERGVQFEGKSYHQSQGWRDVENSETAEHHY